MLQAGSVAVLRVHRQTRQFEAHGRSASVPDRSVVSRGLQRGGTYHEDVDHAPDDGQDGASEDEVMRPLTLEIAIYRKIGGCRV